MKRSVVLICSLVLVAVLAGCSWYKSRMLRSRKEKEAVTCINYYLDFTIERPAEEVFERLSHFDAIAAAIPRARFEYTSRDTVAGVGDYAGGHLGVSIANRDGSKAGSSRGGNLPWQIVVADWAPPRHFTYALSKTQRGFLTLDFTPEDGHTRVKVWTHLFFLPDTTWGRALEDVIERGQLEPVVDQLVTDLFLQAKANLEGVARESVGLDAPPVYEVFEDSYFLVERDFAARPKEMFERLSSPEALTGLLPLARIEAVEGSPARIEGVGNHYRAWSAPELGPEVVYDLVVLQYDPGKEMRFFLAAHGVQIEWEIFITPTLAGAKVQVIFLVNLPQETSGDTLNVIIQTNSIDQYAEDGLAKLAEQL